MAHFARDTVPSMGRPTLGSARNTVLRRIVRDVVARDFGGTKADAARALGISAATVGDFLNEHKGAGPSLTDALTAYLGRSVDQIIAAGGDLDAVRALPPAAAQPQPATTPAMVRFRDLPGWSSLLLAAKKLRPDHAAWVWERLATAPVWLDGPATPIVVAECADIVARHVAPPT